MSYVERQSFNATQNCMRPSIVFCVAKYTLCANNEPSLLRDYILLSPSSAH